MLAASAALVAACAIMAAPGVELWLRLVLLSLSLCVVAHLPMAWSMWKHRAIPGPWPLPFVGNMHSLADGRMHITYEAWRQQYGSIYKYYRGESHRIANPSRPLATNVQGIDSPSLSRSLSQARPTWWSFSQTSTSFVK